MGQVEHRTAEHQLAFIVEHQAHLLDHYAALLDTQTQRTEHAEQWAEYYASAEEHHESEDTAEDDYGLDRDELIEMTHQATEAHQEQSLRAAQEYDALYPTDHNGSIPVFDDHA